MVRASANKTKETLSKIVYFCLSLGVINTSFYIFM